MSNPLGNILDKKTNTYFHTGYKLKMLKQKKLFLVLHNIFGEIYWQKNK